MRIRYFQALCLLIFLYATFAGTSQERGLIFDFGSVSKVGINGFITPYKAHFTPFLGIRYEYYGTYKSRADFLRIPFGIDFHLGNGFRFLFGAALYHSWLINYKEERSHDLSRNLIGGHLSVGWEVRVSSKFSIGVRLRNYRDFTVSYRRSMISNSGNYYEESIYFKEYFIGMHLKYRFTKEKTKGKIS